jgi:carboxyl-terminal processing protease
LVDANEERAGDLVRIPVTPVNIEPKRMFLESVGRAHASSRQMGGESAVSTCGVTRGASTQQAFERLPVEGPLKDAEAPIWDLCDGWGGAIPQ